VSGNELRQRQRRIGEALSLPPATPMISFSAKTGDGKEPLWREIGKAVRLDTGNDL
jgi:hypothetical protein